MDDGRWTMEGGGGTQAGIVRDWSFTPSGLTLVKLLILTALHLFPLFQFR